MLAGPQNKMLPALVIFVEYFLGSIPFGYLIVRWRGGGDVRQTGSGGTGATNVTRRAGKAAGILTLVLDALKGMAAALLARWLLTPNFGVNWWVACAALAAVAGHIFPVWLKFRGGKGVATGLGVFLTLSPLSVISALIVFAVVVWRTRYVSLGSIVAAALLPFLIWWWNGGVSGTAAQLVPLLAAALAGSAVVILMHRANIGRLWRGTESKLK